MKKLFFAASFVIISSLAAFGMGNRPQKGVILFFSESNIVLKTNNTRLEDICDAVSSLTGINIIVDNAFLDKSITVDINEKGITALLERIVKVVPFARYLQILKSDKERELQYFIIFRKAKESKEIGTILYSMKEGLQKAFLSKHNATRMSGKLSISGTFRQAVPIPYDLPGEIKRYAFDFLENNRTLLALNDVALAVKRIGKDFIDYEQYYKGVVIDNLRSYALQVKSIRRDGSFIIVISNNTIPDINISVQPMIPEEKAVQLVIDEFNKLPQNSGLYGPEGLIPESVELKILPRLDIKTDMIIEKFKTMALYWSVNIDFYNFYVDAKTGAIYKVKTL